MAKGKYFMLLQAHGNVDFGENPYQSVCTAEECYGNSIEEMRQEVRRYIEFNGLGGGNICLVDVFDVVTKEMVGQISYNGRFWAGGYESVKRNERGA